MNRSEVIAYFNETIEYCPNGVSNNMLDVLAHAVVLLAQPDSCHGPNCGTQTGDHSLECIVDAARNQGWYDDLKAHVDTYAVLVEETALAADKETGQ